MRVVEGGEAMYFCISVPSYKMLKNLIVVFKSKYLIVDMLAESSVYICQKNL
jgi:hypothetical protein